MAAKLFCILARGSLKAVIFRRGPSKQVRLILWDRKADSFEPGQWFKGRVYERRCDLSPDGKYLAYFAATYKAPLYSWTAISRPPYFTALALWPKGDGWGGGGLFQSPKAFVLNHREEETTLQEGTALGKKMNVTLLGERPGWGEDNPIYHMRLIRDGWTLVSSGAYVKAAWNAKIVWDYSDNPVVYEKALLPRGRGMTLRMNIKGINQRNGSWYLLDHEVANKEREVIASFPQSDWADWDSNGDLLFSKKGLLYRAKSPQGKRGALLLPPEELADFSSMKFNAVATPEALKRW